MSFHRPQLAARLPMPERHTARRVDASSGIASVTATLLRSIQREARGLAGTEPALVEQTLDLISLTFGGRTSQVGADRLLLDRIRGFIEARLADPELSPDAIASAHRISRRYLYRLFERTRETVGDVIRRRRLDRCRAALADPTHDGRTVSEIAFAWGFSDASHFSHVFTERFGVAPRDYRRAAQLAAAQLRRPRAT